LTLFEQPQHVTLSHLSISTDTVADLLESAVEGLIRIEKPGINIYIFASCAENINSLIICGSGDEHIHITMSSKV
jgi:hypothetical protein